MKIKELYEAAIYNINCERMRRIVVKDLSANLTQLVYAPEKTSKIVAYVSSGKETNYRPGFEVSFTDYSINTKYFKTLNSKNEAIKYAKEVLYMTYLHTQSERIK